jgi:hypothetical protein
MDGPSLQQEPKFDFPAAAWNNPPGSKERGDLDFVLAHYYSNMQDRFTSPEEFTDGTRELFLVRQNTHDDVIGYELLTSGQNYVPKTPHPEIQGDVSKLGARDTANGGYFVLNLKVKFDEGVNIGDYKHVRAAYILNTREGRNGAVENPDRNQTAVEGQSRYVYDNPGANVQGQPKSALAGVRLVQALVAGEYNTKTRQLSSNLAYYAVELVFGQDGKLDTTRTRAVQVTKDQFIGLTKDFLPKDKNTKQPCPECSLAPPNAQFRR